MGREGRGLLEEGMDFMDLTERQVSGRTENNWLGNPCQQTMQREEINGMPSTERGFDGGPSRQGLGLRQHKQEGQLGWTAAGKCDVYKASFTLLTSPYWF